MMRGLHVWTTRRVTGRRVRRTWDMPIRRASVQATRPTRALRFALPARRRRGRVDDRVGPDPRRRTRRPPGRGRRVGGTCGARPCAGRGRGARLMVGRRGPSRRRIRQHGSAAATRRMSLSQDHKGVEPRHPLGLTENLPILSLQLSWPRPSSGEVRRLHLGVWT
jgi:hypothetical protein